MSSVTDLAPYARYLAVERGSADHTVTLYVAELERFFAGLPVGADPATATEQDVRDHLLERGGSTSAKVRRLAAIRAYYEFRDLPDPTRKVRRPKRRSTMPRPVPDVEARLGRLEPITRATATFVLETGLRAAELASLDVPLPPPDDLTVRGKGGKDRRIPLTALARACLVQMGGRCPMSLRTLRKRLNEVGAGLHRLRHTFATELIEAGADLGDVQELLGHASPATTRVYAAYNTKRLRAALERRKRGDAA